MAQDVRIESDPKGDACVIRMDPGADGPVDRDLHPLPDVRLLRIGAWQPADPVTDIFEGEWLNSGGFVRLDLEFDGLVNPPGTLGFDQFFDPFLYGAAPFFGYVELDMDADVATGGELSFPELRFSGNAARWGGLPVGARFVDRLARDASAFDHDLSTAPYVDRSGEEFHIALIGAPFENIIQKKGNPDGLFQAGETWMVEGRFFHRAHGYEPFSFACCCQGGDGHYLPLAQLQFAHEVMGNFTTVSLVFPLTNAASAEMRDEGWVEPNDGDACNQSSALEALDDLVFSAVNAPGSWRNDPDFPIVAAWEFKVAQDCLNPLTWDATALLATSYATPDPDGAELVWTDILPDALNRDVNGDGVVDDVDRGAILNFIAIYDGRPDIDEDGQRDGDVDLIDFGPNFCVFDVNYDGRVDSTDGGACTGREALKVKCKRGKFKVKLREGTPGALATFELDGDPDTRKAVRINEAGAAKVLFRKVSPGPHFVEYIECGVVGEARCG
ncbi:MAG: hypothetical protein IT449_05650 [Phycisphaerales bacterium]|nr:hypothetical protein [Phycisphaerales bacterium]